MVNYRRSQTPGGTYFFTVKLRDRSASHLITQIHHLRNCIREVKQQRPFKIIALVVGLKNDPGLRFTSSGLLALMNRCMEKRLNSSKA